MARPREIKFRAWHPEDNKMVMEGWDIESLSCSSDMGCINLGDWENIVHPENLIFMECTLLRDKNGKEIYDGDILEVNATKGCNTEVYFDKHSNAPYNQVIGADKSHSGFLCNWDKQDIEIIGNKYENSKLLKNGKNKRTNISNKRTR